jgi:ribosomal-protein-alanine N-acetyltransferase
MDHGPWTIKEPKPYTLLIFETERLTVRQYHQNDADDFFRFSGNSDVMRYIRPVISRGESDSFLLENIKLYDTYPGTGRWAALEKATGGYVGSFSILVMDAEKNQLHIGYALLPEYWGKGYATELLKTGISYFFANHKGDELFAITQIPNTASQHVLLKAGFTYKGVLEREHDAWLYSLTRTQYAANGY